MRKYVLRHWRYNGQVIPDIMKDFYFDYPKSRGIKIKLSECICQVISEKEYLKTVLQMYDIESHNEKVKKYTLGDWNLIKQDTQPCKK